MKHMVNGREIDLPMEPDGSIDSDQLREAAGIPNDRPLILQLPSGSSRVINPGEKVRVKPEEFFVDAPAHKRGARVPESPSGRRARLMKEFRILSKFFPLWIEEDHRFVIVSHVKLPPGYNLHHTSLLIQIPADYPISPPGIADSRVYVSPALRFRGRQLRDIHPSSTPDFPTPGFGPWAWWCYESIRWRPARDNLIRFVEMVRSDMTAPPTNE